MRRVRVTNFAVEKQQVLNILSLCLSVIWRAQCMLRIVLFESVDAVKAKATEFMNTLSEDNLQHCFQKWKIRMEQCRDWGGE